VPKETADHIDAEIGARIRARRVWLGLTRLALAKATRISHQQMQKYETGAYRIPVAALVKIAGKLETTVSELAAGEAPSKGDLVSLPGGRLDEDAKRLLAAYSRARPDDRSALLSIARGLAVENDRRRWLGLGRRKRDSP
jgi:transcriptional regulator with XRE-family HTH domain